MAETYTVVSEATPTRARIRWGSIVKNVALITGVVLVGVAGAYLAYTASGPLIAYLSTVPYVGTAVTAIGTAIGAAADVAVAAGYWIAEQAASIFGSIGAALPAAAPEAAATAISPENLAMAQHGAGVLGGVVVLKTAYPAAMSHVTPIVEHVPVHHGVDDGGLAAQGHTVQTAAKISHHVVEDAPPRTQTRWLNRFASRAGNGAYADAVKSRQASFREQLTADRDALESALKER